MSKNKERLILLKNARVIPVSGPILENGSVLVRGSRIEAVSGNLDIGDRKPEVVDLRGMTLTPGFIDVHSHSCLMSEPSTMPSNDNDYNEMSRPITPGLRALDSLDPFDYAIPKLRQAGFTSLYTGPGSANLIGGCGVAFKLRGTVADEMVIPGTEQMKMALGENPKRIYGLNAKQSPMTRMGNAAMIREALLKAREYDEKLRKAEEEGKDRTDFNFDLEALRPVVRGEKRVRIHCHKANDICTAIRLSEEFGLLYSLEHVTEGWMIKDYLKEKKPYCVVGPLLLSPVKKELWNIQLNTSAVLAEAGVKVCLTADSASDTVWLPMHAGIMIREGMSEEDAFKALTLYPAEILGVADRLGTIEVGKDADLAAFDGHPFQNSSHCRLCMIDGEIVHLSI